MRGYLTGSGLKDYKQTGTICGLKLPEGLVEASKLPEPIFTPSSKEEVGNHDINISYEQCEKAIGAELAAQVREKAIALYTEAAKYALTKGIIICEDVYKRQLLSKVSIFPFASAFKCSLLRKLSNTSLTCAKPFSSKSRAFIKRCV